MGVRVSQVKPSNCFRQGADLEVGVGGQIRGSGGRKSPSGSRAEAPAGGLRGGSPQKLEHLENT